MRVRNSLVSSGAWHPSSGLAFLSLLLAACAGAPQRDGPVQKDNYDFMSRSLDWSMRTQMQRHSVPGVVLAVVDPQRVVWSKGYGVVEVGRTTPVGVDTCFRVGSVSKVVTATEVMRRVERGDIRLDGPLDAQLPGFAVKSRFSDVDDRPVTVRALLSHHAGLPANRLRGMWEAHPESLTQLQQQLRDEHLLAPPQTRYAYSNLGYALLGRLIEQRSGEAFAEAIRRDLLQPMGLTQAGYERHAQIDANCAPGHRKGKPVLATGLRDDPAGALVATPGELALFLRFVLAEGRTPAGQALMRADTLRSMFEPQFPGLPLDFGHRVGMGWMLSGIEVPGAGPVAWHAGQYPGYFAVVMVAREQGLGALVMANGEEGRDFALATAAKALELALEAQTGHVAAQEPRPPVRLRNDATAAELRQLAGDYAILGTKSKIEAHEHHLVTTLFDHKLELVPRVDDRYVLRKSVLGLLNLTLPDLTVRFADVQSRRYAVLDGLPAPMAFPRLDQQAVPAAWLARLGPYVGSNGDSTVQFRRFELAMDDGVLVARVVTDNPVLGVEQASGKVVLEPVSDNLAVLPGGGALDGGVVLAARRDGRDVLVYSGYVLERVGP